MIRLATIVQQVEQDFIQQFQHKLLPSHYKALSAIKNCRSIHSPKMMMQCGDCSHQELVPHSCGHRHCPHCQNHETQQWIEKQCQQVVPADYFMLTFTLPAQFRQLAFQHQRQVYSLLFECVWATLKTFCLDDDFCLENKRLGGLPGAVTVLHTHSRELNFHPHLHVVMPAGTIDKKTRLWREKKGGYLFNHKALATVFRAKFLDAINRLGLKLPSHYPSKWVVDCRHVGQGNKALVYLGRYLYRGVIAEKDILSFQDGQVTFRYQNSKTKCFQTRTLSAVNFLWLVLQHILPRGFRRTRNFGFLHPNSKTLIKILQWVFRLNPARWLAKISQRKKMRCPCCGGLMDIVKTQLPNQPMVPT